MTKYTSGRQKNLKVGLSSYSETLTSLEVVGKVGIGTTNATSSLYVVGDEYVTGVVTATAFRGNADTATYATNAGIATYATNAGVSTYATNAGDAGVATYAGIATYATNAGIATYAPNSGISTSVIGGIASVTQLSVSGVSTLGITSVTNLTAQQLNVSGISTFVGITTHIASLFGTNASFSGVVTATTFYGNLVGYADRAGIATYSDNAGIATYATNAGIATYATNAGIATQATKLQNSRTFEITGDIVGSPISFDGTGNVSIAATIQPNSVALGSDTTGDYVQSITGTENQISVSVTSGESTTPIVSLPSNLVIPQDATVIRDLQVNRNLNVNGNITIGGTSATLFTETLKISDSDIILGFRTDGFGNDVSNDTTANHGGIAVASTEGTPLVNLNIVGIETLPPTYKKIMWFKAGSFAGLGTDAWLINYGVGIGSAQVPNGVRLAVGGVHVTDNNVTATTFSGSLTGTASSATYATNAGIATYAPNAGIATYAPNAGIATNVIGGIASVTQLSVSGFSTVGVLTATSIGIGTINPTSKLHVVGNVLVSGVSTFIGNGTAVSPAIFAQRDSGNTAGIKLYGTNIGNFVYSESEHQNPKVLIIDSSQSVNILFKIAGSTKATIQPTGELLVGTTTSTGTGSQRLQVDGGAYVSGSVGIGTTNPQSALDVRGAITVGVGTVGINSVFSTTDIQSWYYTGKSIPSGNTSPSGVYVGAAGTTMFVVGNTGDVITQYPLTISYDVSTAGAATTFFPTGTQEIVPTGIDFHPDGTKMFICGQNGIAPLSGDYVHEYSLSTPWNVAPSSVGYTTSHNVSAQEATPTGVVIGAAGTAMYVVGNSSNTVFQYTLTTPYSIAGGNVTYTSKRLVLSSAPLSETSPQDLTFNSTGTVLWVLGNTNDRIYEFRLGTAWDISTAVFYDDVYIGFNETIPLGLHVIPEQNVAYVCGSVSSGDRVFQYSTNTPAIEISSSGISTESSIVLNNETRVKDKLYVKGNTHIDGDTLTQGTLTVDGASTFTGTLTASGSISVGNDVTIGDDLTVSGGTITAGNVATILLGGNTTTGINLADAQTSGAFILGGTLQTGTITLGRATTSQTTNIQAGASGVGTTKTINFGTGGASGSFTQINIGPGPSAGIGTVVINSGTNLLVGTTTPTGTASQPLQVTGGAYVSGSVGIGTTNPIGQLQVSTGPVIIGSATSTGTASQPLQVTGGAYVSTQLGVGVTNPASNTQVAIAGTLGISEVGGSGARTLLSSSGSGFILNHTDNSNINFNSQGTNKLAYRISDNNWSIPSGVGLLVGTGATTGTASQLLQVTGGAYVSGSVGIGTTNPTSALWVGGDGYFVGVVSASNFYVEGNVIGGGSISGDSIVGTALSISGISTLGTVKISSGIVTATTGIVTYYGDGQYLNGVIGFAVNLQDPVSEPVYPMFANNTGVTTAGISTTKLVFVPSSGNLGLGSTNPGSKLAVIGDVYVSGVVTATTFYGSASGLTDIPPSPGSINITDTTTPGTYYPTFTVGTGYTTALNTTTTKFTFNPSTSVLIVKGSPYFGDTNSSITLTNPLAVFTSNVNNYSQVQVQNLFAGGSSSASVDFVATTDSGTDSAEYIDMGINNSGFTAAGLWSAKDGYLYVHAPTAGNGGNLVVGTSGAAGRDIILHTGGTATTNERMRINDTKVTIQDNVEVTSGSIYGKVLAATYGMFMP